MEHLIDSKTAGSRYASRVRVKAPQGSAYDGQTGTVVTQHRDSRTVMVRLDPRYGGLTLPFGRGELCVLEG